MLNLARTYDVFGLYCFHCIILPGECDVKVMSGDYVTYRRIGYLLNGKIIEDKVFETIVKKSGNTDLEKALLGMCVADNRSITLHPTALFTDRPEKVPVSYTTHALNHCFFKSFLVHSKIQLQGHILSIYVPT